MIYHILNCLAPSLPQIYYLIQRIWLVRYRQASLVSQLTNGAHAHPGLLALMRQKKGSNWHDELGDFHFHPGFQENNICQNHCNVAIINKYKVLIQCKSAIISKKLYILWHSEWYSSRIGQILLIEWPTWLNVVFFFSPGIWPIYSS